MAKKQYYLTTNRHPHTNDIKLAIEVEVCTECGVVFIHKPYRLNECPLGHEQDD